MPVPTYSVVAQGSWLYIEAVADRRRRPGRAQSLNIWRMSRRRPKSIGWHPSVRECHCTHHHGSQWKTRPLPLALLHWLPCGTGWLPGQGLLRAGCHDDDEGKKWELNVALPLPLVARASLPIQCQRKKDTNRTTETSVTAAVPPVHSVLAHSTSRSPASVLYSKAHTGSSLADTASACH